MPENTSTPTKQTSVSEKYDKYKSFDPFPSIPEALLNSADIYSYVKETGMIDPFDENELKSASYAAKIAGECRFWNDKTNKFETKILSEKGDKLVLKPNSIAFVGIEPTFRLPDYIALRFNLKITHVYRGLLLGTGPLIDPGFEGKITIPLHNLTCNEYVFSYGETLIWIEFTKTSPLPLHRKANSIEKFKFEENKCQTYVPFPDDKKNKKLDYYLRKALKGYSYEGIVSSIPMAIKKSEKSAANAEKDVKKIRRWSIAGVLALLMALISIVYSSLSLQRDYYEEAVTKVNNLDKNRISDTRSLRDDISKAEKRLSNNDTNIINEFNEIIRQQNNKISELEEKIKLFQGKNGQEK